MTEHSLALALVAVGTLTTTWHGAALRRELASRRWPRATGRVLRASMLHLVTPGGHGQRRLADVEPVVCVEYEVAGAQYRTREIRWAGVPAWAAVRTLRRYPEGRAVAVAYDPAAPQHAVVEPGPSLLRAAYVALGVATLGAGLLLIALPTHPA